LRATSHSSDERTSCFDKTSALSNVSLFISGSSLCSHIQKDDEKTRTLRTLFTRKLKGEDQGRDCYGAYGYWDRVRMPADVMQHTEGVLILDFVDRRIHKLVFRGVGQGVVSPSREKNTAAIQDAVNKIVAPFPAAGFLEMYDDATWILWCL